MAIPLFHFTLIVIWLKYVHDQYSKVYMSQIIKKIRRLLTSLTLTFIFVLGVTLVFLFFRESINNQKFELERETINENLNVLDQDK